MWVTFVKEEIQMLFGMSVSEERTFRGILISINLLN